MVREMLSLGGGELHAHDFVAAGAAILVVLLAIFARAFTRQFLKYRGDRVITCPENQRPAGVRVDASHVLLTTLFSNRAKRAPFAREGKPDLRLKSCSRWPERQDCGQQCLAQIEASPEDCLVRHILTQWYHGKNCALCGKPIGEINWADHKPALLNPQHHTVQWRDVPAQDVPGVLASHQPVCWNCHIVNTMVTDHPEMIVNRSRPI